MLGAFLLIVGIAVAIGVWSGGLSMISLPALGVVLGALAAFIIFGRRAQKSVYGKAEGQAGAAAWALDNLRGKWRVTPGVAATGHFDAVHRVLGRPGVILVGEGSATRVKPLLAQEKKRTARLVGDVPIYDIIVGNGDGEVPLAKLERHLTKLPSNITVKQMDSLESRLSALGSRAGTAAMPKGPLPRRQVARRPADRPPPVTSAPHDGGSGHPVLDAAPVDVDEQRGYDERDQHATRRGAAQPDQQPLVDGRDPQAQRELAGGELEQPHGHASEHQPDRQDRRRQHRYGISPSASRGRPTVRKQPVDQQRHRSAAHAGQRTRTVVGQTERPARIPLGSPGPTGSRPDGGGRLLRVITPQ